MTRTFPNGLTCGLIVLPLLFLGAGGIEAQNDYLRGDLNQDGEVSISDAHASLLYVFANRRNLPDCADARDTNGDGALDIRDAFATVEYIFEEGPPPAAPFPDAGSAEPLLGGCAEYSVGAPLEDAQATLEVLDARISTDEGEQRAIIVLGASHSTKVSGHSFSLELPEGIVTGEPTLAFDRTAFFDRGYEGSRMDGNTFTHGLMLSFGGPAAVPPRDDVAPIYEMWFDLRDDVPAGDYTIGLEAGELIDFETGRAIKPELVSGTLTVPEGVTRLQLPGDCNGDGTVNVSDGICLLGHLFGGEPARLPCGDGSAGSPGNTALLDSNGDGSLDLSDAVSVLGFLFGSSPPPVLGTECVRIPGCPASCSQ